MQTRTPEFPGISHGQAAPHFDHPTGLPLTFPDLPQTMRGTFLAR
jgi:hypothetical protein